MNKNSEYNQRQLEHLYRAILAYNEGKITLNNLVGSLSFLFGVLEDILIDWSIKFQEIWMYLEIMNAELQEDRREITQQELTYINSLTVQLQELVKDQLTL